MGSPTIIEGSAMEPGSMTPRIAEVSRIRIAPWPIVSAERQVRRVALRHFVVERRVRVEPKDFAERRDAAQPAVVLLKRGLKRRPVIAPSAGSKTEARRGCKAITDSRASGVPEDSGAAVDSVAAGSAAVVDSTVVAEAG